MMALTLSLLLSLMPLSSQAETLNGFRTSTPAREMTIKDRIVSYMDQGGAIYVLFSQSTGAYALPKSMANAKTKGILDRLIQEQKTVTAVVDPIAIFIIRIKY